MKLRTEISAILCTLACAASSQAAILAQYDFESTGAPFAPSLEAGGINATNIAPNTGTTAGNSGFVRSTSNPFDGVASLAITFANVDDGSSPTGGTAAPDNITFTITSTLPGQVLNLESLTFLTRLNGNTGGPGADFTIQYDDLSDLAGFQLLSSFNESGIATSNRLIDLSSPLFDNLTAGITFRINITETAGTNATNNSAKLDLITVNGTVPEPASTALLALGGLLLSVRRGKRASL